MLPMPYQNAQSGRVFLLAAVMIIAIAGGILVSSKLMERTRDLRVVQAYPEARPLDDFELHTAAGEPFTRSDLSGRWTLLFFGFTNCPDICPDTLAVLAESMDDLENMGRDTLPQVVFVSVDPARDDGQALVDYVNWFDEDFVGVTGSEAQLESFTRQLGVVYYIGEAVEDGGPYNVDHSASVMVIDPRGRLYGSATPLMEKDNLTADLFALTR